MDEHVMGSADAAAAAAATERLLAKIGETWEHIDGPSTPHFNWRRRQGLDERCTYVAWGPVPKENFTPVYGHRDLNVLVDWFPDLLLQAAEASIKLTGLRVSSPGSGPEPVTPETHRLYWRIRPEFTKASDGRWYLYARLGFAPKDAWILEDTA